MAICEECNGSGLDDNGKGRYEIKKMCSVCKGSGVQPEPVAMPKKKAKVTKVKVK